MPDLAALLRGLPFVIVGATAAALYMAPRQTQDTDVLVSADDASRVESALALGGATKQGDLIIGGSSWRLADGSQLDILVSDEPWVREALATANRDAADLPIVSLPFLVLLKLRASRAVDIGDLSRMLGGADEADLGEVRQVIMRYDPEALEDLESLIYLGHLEFDQPT